MNAKPTPGPWTAHGIDVVAKEAPGMRGYLVVKQDYHEFQFPSSHITEKTYEGADNSEDLKAEYREIRAHQAVCEANARLMAASPDLLTQLKQAVYYFNQNGGRAAYTWLHEMEAAIAKAEGTPYKP